MKDLHFEVTAACEECGGSGVVESKAYKAYRAQEKVLAELHEHGVEVQVPPQGHTCGTCNGRGRVPVVLTLRELASALREDFSDILKPSPTRVVRTNYFHTVKPVSPLGEYLRRKALEKKEANTKTLAKNLGCGGSHVTNIMQGASRLGSRTLRGIALYTGLNSTQLEKMVVTHNKIADRVLKERKATREKGIRKVR
jgi:hypothetical protein